MARCPRAVLVVLVLAFGSVQAAGASQLIDRNATNVQLSADDQGQAMVTYNVGGQTKHVLAWGAVNAIPPSPSRAQVAFKLDYSGGWGRYHRTQYWTAHAWTCLKYDGPPLAWAVAACKAPDGSYWALQAWQ